MLTPANCPVASQHGKCARVIMVSLNSIEHFGQQGPDGSALRNLNLKIFFQGATMVAAAFL